MKKNVLLSSILTIALCLSLVAGSTFALFTDSSFSEVEVKAGDVTMNANLANLKLFSAQADPNGEEFDENGKTYFYAPQATKFSNGGTATITEDLITLTNITPGDKITFELEGKNTSNVAIQYRYRIEVIEGFDLMSGCIFTVEGTKYPAMASYDSKWANLAVGQNVEQNDKIELALELPISAGNYFQNLDAKIKLTVEAVQANADMSATDNITVKYITTADDSTEFLSKLYVDEYLHILLNGDIAGTVTIDRDLTNKTIDADGHSAHLSFAAGTMENVVVKNLTAQTLNIATGVNGDITIADSKFTSDAKIGSAGYNSFIAGRGDAADNLDVTVDNCIFDGKGVVDYGVYFMNIHNLTVRNCQIKNTKSWAIQANGTIGTFVISDCLFENGVGIMKGAVKGGAGTGAVNGNFTFANNEIVNCVGKEIDLRDANGNTVKDPVTGKTVRVAVLMDMNPVAGTLTFSNNTVNGVVATPEDMGNLIKK